MANARPRPNSQESRAATYRELARQAVEDIVDFRWKTERCMAEGFQEIAAGYEILAREALSRAELYMVLADFAERRAEKEA